MAAPILSRAYLKSRPEAVKQQSIKNALASFIQSVPAIAAEGKTSATYYIYEPSNNPHHNRQYAMRPNNVTNEDFIEALKQIFPDCSVSYEETWTPSDPVTRVLKKGILVDWS
jgi:hypothetical protein